MEVSLISELSQQITIENRVAATRTKNGTNATAPTLPPTERSSLSAHSISPQQNREESITTTSSDTQHKNRWLRIRSIAALSRPRDMIGGTERARKTSSEVAEPQGEARARCDSRPGRKEKKEKAAAVNMGTWFTSHTNADADEPPSASRILSKQKKPTERTSDSSLRGGTEDRVQESLGMLSTMGAMNIYQPSLKSSASRTRIIPQDSLRKMRDKDSTTVYKPTFGESRDQRSVRSPILERQDSSRETLSRMRSSSSLNQRISPSKDILDQGSPHPSILQRRKLKHAKSASPRGPSALGPSSPAPSILEDHQVRKQENSLTGSKKREIPLPPKASLAFAPSLFTPDRLALSVYPAVLFNKEQADTPTHFSKRERRCRTTFSPLVEEPPDITVTPATPAKLSTHDWATSRTGLPALPLEVAHKWETPFPGNTRELTRRLLKWHEGMRKQFLFSTPAGHQHLPNNPTATRPINVPLVMMQLWETKRNGLSESNRDVFCIGPGEFSTMIFCEVDVVAERRAPEEMKGNEKSKLSKMLQKLKVSQEDESNTVERNERWAFIVVKGKKEKADHTPPPYLTLAFRREHLTTSSECLFTVYPEEVPMPESPRNSPELGPEPSVHRYASLPAMRRAFSINNLGHRPSTHPLIPLRSVSSFEFITAAKLPGNSSIMSLPPATYPPVVAREDGWTVRRTTFWLKKTLVCVEGFRVDLKPFQDWIEAVGRGEGKMMVYCESEKNIL